MQLGYGYGVTVKVVKLSIKVNEALKTKCWHHFFFFWKLNCEIKTAAQKS